eukprot:TRINITY_DN8482_c0_g1_i1.p1 TRINITY_DN8482_c0_g1~~TRINITY_DN8482_c0_g1_i1.p1  ORF type:complete len:206 (+),score=49.52 TRINITY_DN8482_c0_g1_i1:399-1016(+)
MILTNDGDLHHAVCSKGQVTKEYALTLKESKIIELDDPRIQSLLQGVIFPDGTGARALSVSIGSHWKHGEHMNTIIYVSIAEGTWHIIRRMSAAAQLRLVHLHRVRVGNITLLDADGVELPVGEMRELTTKEVEDLWHLAGGRDQATPRRIAALARILTYDLDAQPSEEISHQVQERIRKWFESVKIKPEECHHPFDDVDEEMPE